ncbi:hypothetical protein J6590_056249 [Homalodisca vitripennis]|nr:hypothetical protein J6590_056249 [Homalodisca vitripennis]
MRILCKSPNQTFLELCEPGIAEYPRWDSPIQTALQNLLARISYNSVNEALMSIQGRPIAMHFNLKGLLRTPEANHDSDQSTVLAVLQTAENNRSSPPGEICHLCPNYQIWHIAPLLLQGSPRAGVQQFRPARHTFYRGDPSEGYRLREDASSGDHTRMQYLLVTSLLKRFPSRSSTSERFFETRLLERFPSRSSTYERFFVTSLLERFPSRNSTSSDS